MQKQVKFTQKTHYIGRNGEGQMAGVDIFTGEFVTYLSPVNSKGDVARCEMQLPYEAMPAIIATLQEAYDNRLTPFKK